MKSTPQEVEDAKALVRSTEERIKRLIDQGRRVHIVWDFDFVLASGLSEDVFKLVKFNLNKYFEYESRLTMSVPKAGIWLPLAEKVGKLHASQDIVTARSSFLAFRVMMFCMWHSGNNPLEWMRWVLYIGHQSKEDSFRIILDSFKNDSNTVIIFVDDNPKHVDAFNKTSSALSMAERTIGIVSPQIRNYEKDQLEWHYNAVMDTHKLMDQVNSSSPSRPYIVPGTPGGSADSFLVMPNGVADFRNICINNFFSSEQKGAIEKYGSLLETVLKTEFPELPITPENLYFAYNYLKEESAHDTMMMDEMMQNMIHREVMEARSGSK